MKLKLEKQKVTTLSSKEMSNLHGGGLKRSIRRNGQCNYSYTEGQATVSTFANVNGPGTTSRVTSCHAPKPASVVASISGTISGSVSEDVAW